LSGKKNRNFWKQTLPGRKYSFLATDLEEKKIGQWRERGIPGCCDRVTGIGVRTKGDKTPRKRHWSRRNPHTRRSGESARGTVFCKGGPEQSGEGGSKISENLYQGDGEMNEAKGRGEVFSFPTNMNQAKGVGKNFANKESKKMITPRGGKRTGT